MLMSTFILWFEVEEKPVRQESLLSIFALVSQNSLKVLHMKGNYGTVLGGILISTSMRMKRNKINRPMSGNPINSRLEIHYHLGTSRSRELCL